MAQKLRISDMKTYRYVSLEGKSARVSYPLRCQHPCGGRQFTVSTGELEGTYEPLDI